MSEENIYSSQSLILKEFDFRSLGDGRSASARYANHSNYRNDSLIRKESMLVLNSHKLDFDIVSVRELFAHLRNQANSQGQRDHEVSLVHVPSTSPKVSREDDSKWPEKNRDGRQELEVRLGNDHISFEVHTPSKPCLLSTLTANRRPR